MIKVNVSRSNYIIHLHVHNVLITVIRFQFDGTIASTARMYMAVYTQLTLTA